MVGGGGVELFLAHLHILIDEDPVPGHMDVIKEQHRVILIKAVGQGIVEFAGRVGFIGFAGEDF